MHRAVESVPVKTLPNGEKRKKWRKQEMERENMDQRWILPPAKQHISDSAVKGALIWASEPRMSLVSIPGMFSITLPLLSCFVADLSITARSSRVSRWRASLLCQTRQWRQNTTSPIRFPTDCFPPIPEAGLQAISPHSSTILFLMSITQPAKSLP